VALLFWDASALAKRYFGELGSDTVNALFTSAEPEEMLTTPWSSTTTTAGRGAIATSTTAGCRGRGTRSDRAPGNQLPDYPVEIP
jgi:hypothetical protein